MFFLYDWVIQKFQDLFSSPVVVIKAFRQPGQVVKNKKEYWKLSLRLWVQGYTTTRNDLKKHLQNYNPKENLPEFAKDYDFGNQLFDISVYSTERKMNFVGKCEDPNDKRTRIGDPNEPPIENYIIQYVNNDWPKLEWNEFEKINDLATNYTVIICAQFRNILPGNLKKLMTDLKPTRCLINPFKKHDTHNPIIYGEKRVVKHCCICPSVQVPVKEAKKIYNMFNVSLQIETKENNVFQDLVEEMLDIAKKHDYKREEDTGVVYKRITSYVYVRYLELKKFLNQIFYSDKNFASNVNNMDNMIRYMKNFDDERLQFIEYNKDYIGFRNGVLNIVTVNSLSVPMSQTPLLDSVLDYQFDSNVRDFIYMCMGRCFGIRDNFGFMLYLLSEPGCGKSLLINVLCQCFNDVGAIGDNFEKNLGSFLYNKDIIICDDVPKHISKVFPQQTCITGGKVPIAVKGGQGFTVDFNVPMIWAGNWFIDYVDRGQVTRRVLVANFEKHIAEPDTTLFARIIESELPAFIYKSVLLYMEL
ncbi:hypothetical protein HDU84_007970 [Entophlyctis sp. JEL0112]|nr:hypothetical protein HDU84_007970 [Entophlyctis sp. JEL0112]